MTYDLSLTAVAAAIGDSARAAILIALMDKRSRTAKELAFLARISASTASAHLGKLLDLGLVSVTAQGRNRFFKLASPLVGQMLETMSNVAAEMQPRHPRAAGTESLRLARTCYDHLAGRIGVMIADALQEQGHVRLSDDGGEVTDSGRAFFLRLGLDIDRVRHSRRIFCKPCLDWTERRPHLAGSLGAALCRHCLDQGWVERMRDSRALTITPEGRKNLIECFGIELEPTPADSRSAALA
jgi:DNA-binding transcriptional ArsR family regulator